MIFPKYDEWVYCDNNTDYIVWSYCSGDVAYVNLWGKRLPEKFFDELVHDMFEKYIEVQRISVIQSYTNYNFLRIDDDIVLHLPDSITLFLARLSAKHRYNIRREKR